jgi:hypothetical protein
MGQLSKGRDDFVDLRICKTGHDVFNYVRPEAICDDVADDLLIVARGDRNDADVGGTRRRDKVPELFDHSLCNGIGGVDYEQTLWRTQFS